MKSPVAKAKQIVALYKKGLRPVDIAAKLGVSRQRVHQVLTAYPSYVPRSTAVAGRRKQVAELYKNGSRAAVIARILNISVSLVKSDLGTLGLAGLRDAKLAKRRKHVRALREQGVASVQIAKRMGIQPRTVSSDVYALGLPRRRRASCEEALQRRAQVAALRKQGYGMRAVAKRLGLPVSTIQGYFLAAGRRK